MLHIFRGKERALSEKTTLAFGALLHDIGKIIYRDSLRGGGHALKAWC